MRIDVKKYLFIGKKRDKNLFFEKAQEIGVIHFIDLSQGKEGAEYPLFLHQLAAAIKTLKPFLQKEQKGIDSNEKAIETVQEILVLKEEIEKLKEEIRSLHLEISRVEVFGSFSMEDIQKIEKEGKRFIQFFSKKAAKEEKMPYPSSLLFIGQENGIEYYLSVSSEKETYPDFHLVEMHLTKSLGQLKEELKIKAKNLLEKEHFLKGYAFYRKSLSHYFVNHLNDFELMAAKKGTQDVFEEKLFYAEAFIPENKVKEIEDFAHKEEIFAEEIAFEEEDKVPTYLENEGMGKVGEDLVHIYDTPSLTDKDPSLWVLFSFALFFSIIIGDGGYGIIFLIASLWMHYQWQKTDGKKEGLFFRMKTLSLVLSVFCIAWGFISGSFFGLSLAPDNPIKKYSLMQYLAEEKAAYHIKHQDAVYKGAVKNYPKLSKVTDPYQFLIEGTSEKEGVVSYDLLSKFTDNLNMELALFIGSLHVILSFLRYIFRNPSGWGWIAFILGAWGFFPPYLEATSFVQYLLGISPQVASYYGAFLMEGGISFAIGISLIRNGWYGLLEIPNLVQVFGDILSYLRLYALGLAGAIMGATINEMAASTFWLFGIIILALGHGMNIVLSIMGGVIHGLRLNFLEWYHYSFEGGGRAFKPLKKIKNK